MLMNVLTMLLTIMLTILTMHATFDVDHNGQHMVNHCFFHAPKSHTYHIPAACCCCWLVPSSSSPSPSPGVFCRNSFNTCCMPVCCSMASVACRHCSSSALRPSMTSLDILLYGVYLYGMHLCCMFALYACCVILLLYLVCFACLL